MVNYKDFIANIPNFPMQGIMFRDITPLLANGEAFKQATSDFVAYAKKVGANVVVAPESRGFIFATPIANELNIGFVPARKPGKLPREFITEKYDLEYGVNELSIHKDAIKPGDKVVIIDDLLATGGTISACIKLVEALGGEVVGNAFVIELSQLNGRERLKDYDVYCLVKY